MFACAIAQSAEPFVIVSRDDSTRVEIQTASPIGRIELWAPEAIMSERGSSAIYPTGTKWRRVGQHWEQSIGVRESYGPGNYSRVGDTIEFIGIKFPVDSPVSWTTRLKPGPQRVEFEIRLRNAGTKTIRRAAAAVCVKFLDARWWSDGTTFGLSSGKVTSLLELGRDVGADDRFEAYLLRDEKFANPFYEGFWGFNRHCLDRPMLVSEHRAAGCCAVVTGDRAYFMHSNRVNPCTDVMLAFGDVEPGAKATARGYVTVESGRAAEILARKVKPRDSQRALQPSQATFRRHRHDR
jgi:hypothetical protein